MNRRYIAFDVETPNSRSDRMSAIGVAVIENSRIVRELYSLVNPETHFDYFNVMLTGITPEMVTDQPTFPELWTILEPVFDSGILIAHNAPFDMSVLSKCLRYYGIDWKPTADYVCTCQMGRRAFPELPSHKLNTLCNYLGFELEHHNAGSDTRACARLLLRYMDDGLDPTAFLRRYDLQNTRTIPRARKKS